MNVRELIEFLSQLPQEAEVKYFYDYRLVPLQEIYLSHSDDVVLSVFTPEDTDEELHRPKSFIHDYYVLVKPGDK